jgi:hypothetical protein
MTGVFYFLNVKIISFYGYLTFSDLNDNITSEKCLILKNSHMKKCMNTRVGIALASLFFLCFTAHSQVIFPPIEPGMGGMTECWQIDKKGSFSKNTAAPIHRRIDVTLAAMNQLRIWNMTFDTASGLVYSKDTTAEARSLNTKIKAMLAREGADIEVFVYEQKDCLRFMELSGCAAFPFTDMEEKNPEHQYLAIMDRNSKNVMVFTNGSLKISVLMEHN